MQLTMAPLIHRSVADLRPSTDSPGCLAREVSSTQDAWQAKAVWVGSGAGMNEVNEVRLVGRVSADPECRELPSGDAVTTLRVVVKRPAGAGAVASRATVDTIDIACWSAATRRVAGRLVAGQTVEVTGALRRRFFRGPDGAASRYEVEVTRLRRVGSGAGR